jgi:hypothetical protein
MRPWRSLCLLACLALMAGCGGEPSVEDQVRAAIAQMEELGEEGDRSGFLDMLTDDYQGQDGRYNKDEFGKFLMLQWSQHRRIRAQLFPVTVTELGPNLATASFRVLLTGGAGLLPETGQLYEVETRWLREGSDWQLWQAQWKAAGAADPILGN